jgi:hypothetical protein
VFDGERCERNSCILHIMDCVVVLENRLAKDEHFIIIREY